MTTSVGLRISSMIVSNGIGPSPKAAIRSASGCSLSNRLIAHTHAGRTVSSVPASKRARVSARRTLPLVVRGIVPGGVTTTRSSSRPAVSRTRRRTCSIDVVRGSAGARLEHGDDSVGFVEVVDAEDHDARRPDPFDVGDRRFEIGRMVLASLPDDQILRAAADEQLAVGDVPQIAGVQPAAVKRFGGGVGILEVALPSPTVRATTIVPTCRSGSDCPSSSTICRSWPGNGRPQPTMRTAREPLSTGTARESRPRRVAST